MSADYEADRSGDIRRQADGDRQTGNVQQGAEASAHRQQQRRRRPPRPRILPPLQR